MTRDAAIVSTDPREIDEVACLHVSQFAAEHTKTPPEGALAPSWVPSQSLQHPRAFALREVVVPSRIEWVGVRFDSSVSDDPSIAVRIEDRAMDWMLALHRREPFGRPGAGRYTTDFKARDATGSR